MKPLSAASRRRGILPVWGLAAGLSVSLLMVVLLLGVIVINGLVVFWPRDILVLNIDDTENPVLGAQLFDKVTANPAELGRERVEYYLFQGSPEVLGEAFRYLSEDSVKAISRPPNAVLAERREHGNALFQPLHLELESGETIAAEDARFWPTLRKLLRLNEARRAEMAQLENGPISAVNHALKELNEMENRYRMRGDPIPKEELKAERQLQEQRYQELMAQMEVLRHPLERNRLHYALFSGEHVVQPIGELLELHKPNAMSPFDKLHHFLKNYYQFVTESPREGNTSGGIYPIIFGTFVLTLLMSIVVMPLGVCAAIYLREYARPGPIVHIVRICVSNLAGVPSIVYGVFGLGFFVYFLGGSIDEVFFADKLPAPTFGTGGILWAALTLALLTVPVVIVATEESLSAFPLGIREAALACGASRFQTIFRVVLPASTPGILTGLILAVARAAGEVAPLMLVGVVAVAQDLPIDGQAPFLHLDRKFMHMGYHIYSLGFLTPNSEAAMPIVFATTLILILLVLALNLVAMILRDRMRHRYYSGTF